MGIAIWSSLSLSGLYTPQTRLRNGRLGHKYVFVTTETSCSTTPLPSSANTSGCPDPTNHHGDDPGPCSYRYVIASDERFLLFSCCSAAPPHTHTHTRTHAAVTAKPLKETPLRFGTVRPLLLTIHEAAGKLLAHSHKPELPAFNNGHQIINAVRYSILTQYKERGPNVWLDSISVPFPKGRPVWRTHLKLCVLRWPIGALLS